MLQFALRLLLMMILEILQVGIVVEETVEDVQSLLSQVANL